MAETSIRSELIPFIGECLSGRGEVGEISYLLAESPFPYKVLLRNLVFDNGIALEHCWVSCNMVCGIDTGDAVTFEGIVYRYRKKTPKGIYNKQNRTVQRQYTDYGLTRGFISPIF